MNAEDARRQAVIDGLRELADFLEAHPDVPVENWQKISYSASNKPGDDEAARAEIDRIAALIEAHPVSGAHYVVSRGFGGGGTYKTAPVTYEAYAIPEADQRRYQAAASYQGHVEPEEANA